MYIGMRPGEYGHGGKEKDELSKIQLGLRADIISKPDGQLMKQLGWLEAFLGDNEFMAGKSPTIADCQVIPRLRHLKKGILDGIPTTLVADNFPKLQEYYDRFHAIP